MIISPTPQLNVGFHLRPTCSSREPDQHLHHLQLQLQPGGRLSPGLLPQYRGGESLPGQAEPHESAEDQEDQAGRAGGASLQVSLSVQRHALRTTGGHRSAPGREE